MLFDRPSAALNAEESMESCTTCTATHLRNDCCAGNQHELRLSKHLTGISLRRSQSRCLGEVC